MASQSLALLLLAVLASATAHAEEVVCNSTEWQCVSGECIDGMYRCRGFAYCKDGSDNVASVCDKVMPTSMQVGQVTKVQFAGFKKEHAGIEFNMCNGTNCSSILLYGFVNGTLFNSTWTGCNAFGLSCAKAYYLLNTSWQHFSSDLFVFMAELRSGVLAVWQDGRKDIVATVPVPEGYHLLTVRPLSWTSDLLVVKTPDLLGSPTQPDPTTSAGTPTSSEAPAPATGRPGQRKSSEAPAPTGRPGPTTSSEAPAPTGRPGPTTSSEAPAPTGRPGLTTSSEAPAPTGRPGPTTSSSEAPAPTGRPGPTTSSEAPHPIGRPGPPTSSEAAAATGRPGPPSPYPSGPPAGGVNSFTMNMYNNVSNQVNGSQYVNIYNIGGR